MTIDFQGQALVFLAAKAMVAGRSRLALKAPFPVKSVKSHCFWFKDVFTADIYLLLASSSCPVLFIYSLRIVTVHLKMS